MAELSDYGQRENENEPADDRFMVYFNVYSLSVDTSVNKNTFRCDTKTEFELDSGVFQSLYKLHEALIKLSNSEYLKQQFFRITVESEIESHLDNSSVIPVNYITTSEQCENLIRGSPHTLKLAAVRYTKAQMSNLTDYISSEEREFLNDVMNKKKEDSFEVDNTEEINEVKEIIEKQVSSYQFPNQEFATILIKREKVSQFVDIAYSIRCCNNEKEAVEMLKSSGIAKRLFK